MEEAALGEQGLAFDQILQLVLGKLLCTQQDLQQSAIHTTHPSALGNWRNGPRVAEPGGMPAHTACSVHPLILFSRVFSSSGSQS